MSLSTLISTLFSGSESELESVHPADRDADGADGASATIIHECRACGTNVASKTTRCPACDSDDIVTYSID